MAGFLTRRVTLLALVASVLCGYLITRAYGVEVLTVTLIGVIALVGVVVLLWRLSRVRQLSMRTLVFVLPLPVAFVAIMIGHLHKSRIQQAVVAEAGVHAEYTRDGIYGVLNHAISRLQDKPYHPMLPSEIFQLGFELDCQNVAKLQRLDLPRLQEVRIFQVRVPTDQLPQSTIDWLNQLPDSVRMDLTCTLISAVDATKLHGLSRPLERLNLLNCKLSDDELAAVLAIPTESLIMKIAASGFPEELSVSASPSRKLVVAGLPTSQAVRLARWKQCTSLSLWEAELSLPDCHELAALELEELELGKVSREQLQILLESKSLKRLLASVVGVDEAELQRIKTQALPDKQLNFGRLR